MVTARIDVELSAEVIPQAVAACRALDISGAGLVRRALLWWAARVGVDLPGPVYERGSQTRGVVSGVIGTGLPKSWLTAIRGHGCATKVSRRVLADYLASGDWREAVPHDRHPDIRRNGAVVVRHVHLRVDAPDRERLVEGAAGGQVAVYVRECIRRAARAEGVRLPPSPFRTGPNPGKLTTNTIRVEIPDRWHAVVVRLAGARGEPASAWVRRACGLPEMPMGRRPSGNAPKRLRPSPKARYDARMEVQRAASRDLRALAEASREVAKARPAPKVAQGACPTCGAARVASRPVMEEAVATCAAGHEWWRAAA